jgi:aryl-alcohol dehydrogenase-like predicted oxidoreductase
VPHSSGLLEGHYTEDTTFAENDHRRHRPRSWLLNGIKKVDQLSFLTDARPGATLGQVALRWIRDPRARRCPTSTARSTAEFPPPANRAAHPDELARVQELYETNFWPGQHGRERHAGASR